MNRDRQGPHHEDEDSDQVLKTYWRRYAEAFAVPLRSDTMLGNFITNPAVTGAYAEVWVRRLVESMVLNLRLSTGAVIRTTDILKDRDLRSLPQSDLILWDPTELPAIFQSGEFALVHTQAARAIIEIKRSVRNVNEFQDQLRKQRARLLPEYRRNVLGIAISHRRTLLKNQVDPAWVTRVDRKADVPMTRLLNSRSSRPDVDGVFALIYFLSYVARQQLPTRQKL